MTKPNQFEIVYNNPAGVYNAGQVVKGTVNLDLPEELKIRNSEDGKTLLAGTHSYPFQIKLPEDLPSSFEHCCGKVRYYAECCIDRPWAFNYTSQKAFSVISIYDLNTVMGVTGTFQNEDHKTLCCLCCKSEPIEGIIRIKRKAFVPGEKVTFDAEISNRSSRTMAKTEVALKQVITFYTTDKRASTTRKRTIRKMEHGSIPAKGSDNWINESIMIPPLPPSGLKGCSIIDITYFLELNIDPSGPSTDLSIPLEIIIGNVPLKETFNSFNQLASQANYSAFPPMPADKSGMVPLDIEAQRAKAAPIAPLLPNAPPPVYHMSVFGTSALKEKDDKDNGEVMGQLEFAPVYLTYHYDNTAFDPAVEQ